MTVFLQAESCRGYAAAYMNTSRAYSVSSKFPRKPSISFGIASGFSRIDGAWLCGPASGDVLFKLRACWAELSRHNRFSALWVRAARFPRLFAGPGFSCWGGTYRPGGSCVAVTARHLPQDVLEPLGVGCVARQQKNAAQAVFLRDVALCDRSAAAHKNDWHRFEIKATFHGGRDQLLGI